MEKTHIPKLPKSFDFQETLLKKRSSYTEAELKEVIRSLHLKVTQQRLMILKILNSGQRKHITAQELYERVSAEDSSIGFATVYRLLKKLADSHLVTEVRVGGAPARYELNPKSHHDHITCIQCGKISEFENQEIEQLQSMVAKKMGYQLTSHVLELFGICLNCQKHNFKKEA